MANELFKASHVSINSPLSKRILECSFVSSLILFFLANVVSLLLPAVNSKPEFIDPWFFCYRIENQITRILGLNPGGLWEGGFYFPFHKISILFDEPTWGISLLAMPAWLITKNIFLILNLGSIPALFLSWIFTYYFVKRLGGTRLCSFWAGAAFCLSGVNLVYSLHIVFWPFFLIPLLGLITLKIFSTPKFSFGVLWGITFGYLAWSSMHLLIMGGSFLLSFILWNILFNNPSRKTFLVLSIALIVSGLIASAVLGPLYFTWKSFGFNRGYYHPYLYASNWANLLYRSWPTAPFNPLTKSSLWHFLKTHVTGEPGLSCGIPFSLLLGALVIFVIILRRPSPREKISPLSKYLFAIVAMIISISLAFLNMYALKLKCLQCGVPAPKLAPGITYFCYIVAGTFLFGFRNKIKSAINRPDFFLLLTVIFFGFIMFGPYYLIKDKSVIAAPVAFLIYHVPGFSGIQVLSRWGMIFSFTLSVAVALSLSKYASTIKRKIGVSAFMLITLLEIMPGFQMPDFKGLSPYKWTPRATDIFLKNLPGNGAVLELESYPIEREQRLSSDNSLGYALYSRLYHKKPLVAGYSSCVPPVTSRFCFFPEDQTWSVRTVQNLKKFGPQYWVFHTQNWSSKQRMSFLDSLGGLKQIAQLDGGKTFIFEDPTPKISPSLFNVDLKIALDKGLKLLQNEKFDKAEVEFARARTFDPENATAYWGLATCASSKKQPDTAISLLNKAIKLDPSQGIYYDNRAVLYSTKKEYSKAWGDVETAETLGFIPNPNFVKGLKKALSQAPTQPATTKNR